MPSGGAVAAARPAAATFEKREKKKHFECDRII